MKRFWRFQTEGMKYNRWRELTSDEIALEYKVEYRHIKPVYGDVFPTVEDFQKAVKKAKVMEVTPAIDRKISYRSHTTSIDDLESLVSTYKRPRDIQRIIKGYKENAKMPYPLVISHKGKLRVMGGNSRMDVAFILGFNPKVKVIEI